MLTSARPLFRDVPGSFADPVGLAAQQGLGTVSLVVVRYPAHDGHPLGDVYDAYVAVSGQLVAVARSTRDYRFPVTPAAALDRFLSARDAGRDAFVSLYETTEPDCARFLETVFYAECLKLHVDGDASAALVAGQLAHCGCQSGILELNDFSDPAAPRVFLADLDEVPESLPDLLGGFAGRALLYDRAKNRAALPGRAGTEAFDLQGAIDQAARLADTRHADARRPPRRPDADSRDADSRPDPAERVERRLADHARQASRHPQTSALRSLIGELSGTAPSADAPLAADASISADVPSPADAADPADAGRGAAQTRPPAQRVGPPEGPTPEALCAPAPGAPAPGAPVPEATSPAAAAAATPDAAPAMPPALSRALDVLRVEVFRLVADAVGDERAQAHEAHVCRAHAIPSPVPAEQVVPYLRALLCDDPPRRWHFFRQRRHDVREAVCRKLLALHAAHAHTEHAALHQATRLWSRLRK